MAFGGILAVKPKGEERQVTELLNLWWPLEDSNLQPKDYESSALPLS